MTERIAIVVPRCAETAYGGVELLALRLAQELQARFDIEILTTCATDYWTWQNELPAGSETLEGVALRRFPVDAPRALREFDRLSRSFRYRIQSLSTAEQEAWIKAQGPYSTALWQYLFEQRHAYDAFVFMPYLYATTYFGLPIVRERSILLPLAHDEWPLYFPVWERLFGYARGFGFVTVEERELLRRRFARETLAGEVIYPRFAAADAGDMAAAPTTVNPFMLYLGRMDEAKGVAELIACFQRHLELTPESPWRLVLAGDAGSRADALPIHERISHMGKINESAKRALLRSCDLLVMPSLHESLSIALIEGWLEKRPALVNGRNPVLVGQVRRANGGLWYDSPISFDAALAALTEEVRHTLGAQGFSFVHNTYGRGNVVEAFERMLERLRLPAQPRP